LPSLYACTPIRVYAYSFNGVVSQAQSKT
jgi:hypothetical protein